MSNGNTAKIDANDKPTWLLYNETTGLPEPACVDPTTGALLVYAVPTDSNTPATLNTAKIDANDNATLLGWNETTSLVEALRCGNDGSLLIISV